MKHQIAILGLVLSTLLATIQLHAQSVWDDSDPGGDIYYNGGNVGIGTATPAEKLDIQNGSIIGYSSVGAFLKIKRKSGQPSIKGIQDGTSGTDGHVIIDAANTAKAVYLNHYLSANVYLATGGGKVGIGTTTPSEPLNVSSTNSGVISRFISSENGGINGLRIQGKNDDGSDTQFFDIAYDAESNTYGFGAGSSSGSLPISSGFGQTDILVNGSGQVGIGTAAPSHTLDVDGSVRVADADGTGLLFSEFTSALTDVPGSTGGVHITGPVNAHVVMDIRGNNATDGFYVRVPTVLEAGPTVDRTAFVVKSDGEVGIGTTDTHGYELAVAGGILAEKVYMAQQANWPDYVFSSRYSLKSLEETEAFIEANHHLPEIPSATEVQENGYDVGQMNAKLLQKIEELTLYLIDQNKKIDQVIDENKKLKSRVTYLEADQ